MYRPVAEFLYVLMGSILEMSPEQMLEMALEGENNVLWEEVVQRCYVCGKRISGCSFMRDGLNLHGATTGLYGVPVMQKALW